MTVVVWDGKTLAADKRANNQGTVSVVTKIKKIRGCLVASCDSISSAGALFNWFEKGGDPENYPKYQDDKDKWAPLLVITPEKRILRYEETPYPYEIEQLFYAMGSGRDFALGALEMGATSRQAVLVASRWDCGCGNGVDELEFAA